MEINKIEELKKYFVSKKEDYEVANKVDFISQNIKFRFCKGKEIKIFEVSRDVMEDLSIDQIIQKLEKGKWESVLESPNRMILTHAGFREK